MKRHCLTLDLKDDPALIQQYVAYHANVWPEIKASILASGIQQMEIYLLGHRLFMIMEVEDNFSFTAKAIADSADPKVQEWETLMWRYQAPLPQARPGEKWLMMDRIFTLMP
jgi:L-rhamnose mutarotase